MTYDPSSITILENVDAIRKRPGMYIGETNRIGLHHLIFEILDNSIDEALAGYCKQISIKFYPADNSIEITDDGRGIPVGIHPDRGISAATIVFTVLHAGGKFGGKDSGGYGPTGGLHGVGATVTNALSRYLEVTIRREGKVYYQRFEKGVPCGAISIIRDMLPTEKTGTSVKFSPDAEMFPEAELEEGGITLSSSSIKDRIQKTAYLVKQLRFTLQDEFGEQSEYYSEEGLNDFVNLQSKQLVPTDIEPDTPATLFENNITFEESDDTSKVEVCFNYVAKYYNCNILSFANIIHTKLGGTHVQGFELALKNVLNAYAAKQPEFKKSFSSEDVVEGLNAVISFSTKEPKFGDQTKQKLVAGAGQKLTYAATKSFLENWLEKNPQEATLWIAKVQSAQKMREKLERERDKVRQEQATSGLSSPLKLADCQSRKPEDCELFLVEGDSAGGSAKQARDRRTQAILPLKGKILNISKISSNKKIIESAEIASLISALKCGIGEDFNYAKLRYHKIIIMTDADVDGAHIATLFLNFFLNEMPDLVKKGHIYLAMPPLYVAKKKDDYTYYADKEHLDAAFPNGFPSSISVQRFKGLGEMDPKQLDVTTMNPKSRNLMQVSFDPTNEQKIYQIFEDLMGTEVEKRREFIMANAKQADLDI